AREHPLADAVAELRRDLPVDWVALKGLHREAVAALLAAASPGGEAPPEFVDALTAETAGNPLFLRELLLHLRDEGRLGADRPREYWRLTVDEIGLPQGVREVVGRRLARLSDAANRFLATASGSGVRFRFDCVAAASRLDQTAALDALEVGLR